MKHIAIEAQGPNNSLVLGHSNVPQPQAGELLIRVRAAGVNRPDLLQRQGLYDPPEGASPILGLEIAGEVVGDETRKVCALVTGGGYGEYCTAPESQCLPIPGKLSFEEAAALPETFFTVWTNLVDYAGLQPGETLLVHGGTSGVGTTAIQIAKHLGATVFVTAGSGEKCEAARKLGADLAINYNTEDFVDAVKGATGGKGANVILDIIGGDYLVRNMKCLAERGRHISISMQRGRFAEIDIFRMMAKRHVLTGSILRPRTIARKAAIAKALHEHIWPELTSGKIKPVIDSVYPLAKADEAHAHMRASKHIGKIVLKVD